MLVYKFLLLLNRPTTEGHWQMFVSERALQGTVLRHRTVSRPVMEPAHTHLIARSPVGEISASGPLSTDQGGWREMALSGKC